jgi:hypothetical protein
VDILNVFWLIERILGPSKASFAVPIAVKMMDEPPILEWGKITTIRDHG